MRLYKSKKVPKPNVAATAVILALELCFMHTQVQAQWGTRSQRLGNSAKAGSWTNADGIWGYCPESGSGLRITSYRGTAKDIATPAKINGMPVHSIGRRAFAGTYVEMIRISEGVFALEKDAFRACKSLHRVTLPKSLERYCIDSSAFQYCKNLELLIIPETLKDVFSIPKQARAFYYKNDPSEIDSSVFVEESTPKKDIFDTDSKVNLKDESIRRVTFDPNRESTVGRYHYGVEGSGTMEPISFNIGDAIKLPPNKFTCSVRKSRAGDFYIEEYSFAGWATNKAGKVVFLDCSDVKLSGDTILYAMWSPPRHIRFNANGGKGSMSPLLFKKSESIKLPKNGFVRLLRPNHRPNEEAPYIFAGWTTSKDGDVVYADEAEAVFDIDKDVTLYAKWMEACEVHFMPNFSDFGPSCKEMQPMKMLANKTFALVTNAYERQGYEFIGWALEPKSEAKFADGANVSFGHGVVNLYACWKDPSNYHLTLHADNRIERYEEEKTGRRRKRRIDSESKEILIPREGGQTLPLNKNIGFQCHSRNLEIDEGYYCGEMVFAGWALGRGGVAEGLVVQSGETVCDGTVVYADGATITPNSDMDLYAVWRPKVAMEIRENVLYEANLYANEAFELPANITNIAKDCKWSNAWRVKEFQVHPDNPAYSANKGILYDKSGKTALGLMSALREIVIPAGVTAVADDFIRNGAKKYYVCSRYECPIEKIIFPDGLVSIGSSAFSGCNKVTEIKFPRSLTYIGAGAFEGCVELKEITIPDEVRTIERCTFSDCKNLLRASLPDHLVDIGSEAFSGCVNLEGIVIPETVTNISGEAFAKCGKLTDLTIPASVRSIKREAFGDCKSLTNIVIRGGKTECSSAFFGCYNIVAATIPFEMEECPFGYDRKLALTIDMWDGESISVGDVPMARSMNWPELRKWVEFQKRRDDDSYKFPAHSFCAAHPALYKDFCAGASKAWCENRYKELQEEARNSGTSADKNTIQFTFDDKLGILTEVVVRFPDPGVSLDALKAKYKRNSNGEFKFKREVTESMGDSKEVFQRKMAKLNDKALTKQHYSMIDNSRIESEKRQIVDAMLGGYERSKITISDDEICVSLKVCDTWGLAGVKMAQDVYSRHFENDADGKIKIITISSRKLNVALAERERNIKAEKAKAEAEAAVKKENDALDF